MVYVDDRPFSLGGSNWGAHKLVFREWRICRGSEFIMITVLRSASLAITISPAFNKRAFVSSNLILKGFALSLARGGSLECRSRTMESDFWKDASLQILPRGDAVVHVRWGFDRNRLWGFYHREGLGRRDQGSHIIDCVLLMVTTLNEQEQL